MPPINCIVYGKVDIFTAPAYILDYSIARGFKTNRLRIWTWGGAPSSNLRSFCFEPSCYRDKSHFCTILCRDNWFQLLAARPPSDAKTPRGACELRCGGQTFLLPFDAGFGEVVFQPSVGCGLRDKSLKSDPSLPARATAILPIFLCALTSRLSAPRGCGLAEPNRITPGSTPGTATKSSGCC